GTLLLPAALAFGWINRRSPGVRFALCWLIPSWLVFELTPTKLAHYPLPLYGALAWLAAAAMVAGPIGPRARWIGAVLSAVIGALLAGGVVYLLSSYGDPSDAPAGLVAGVLLAGAGLAGGYLM